MSSPVLIDCSGISLTTRKSFVCAKEMIQEGRKLFFAYLTMCCVVVLSSINSWWKYFRKDYFETVSIGTISVC